jgi:hypothetical protein
MKKAQHPGVPNLIMGRNLKSRHCTGEDAILCLGQPLLFTPPRGSSGLSLHGYTISLYKETNIFPTLNGGTQNERDKAE